MVSNFSSILNTPQLAITTLMLKFPSVLQGASLPVLDKVRVLSLFPKRFHSPLVGGGTSVAAGTAGGRIPTIHPFHEVQDWRQLPFHLGVVSCDVSPTRNERPGDLSGGFRPLC